ncbi:MAG: PEP-CTERM sorting domain-containing protein [Planctomycetes bacterium]|nr:PEP-CTERM sorting domain-containing protein [Planctomycetota bacterium]
MRTLVGLCLGLVLTLAVAVNAAQATTLQTTTFAYNDGNGPSLGVWQGSQNYTGALFFNTLDADVEFAVFAPGNFQGFLNENGIVFADPAPSEYIYAYQIVNIAPGTSAVTNFTVGLQSDESLGISGVTFIPAATDYGTYSQTPIQDPVSTGGGPGVDSSSAWAHFGLLPGEASGILFYSSPQVPELGFSAMTAGIANQFLANSLPNPSTIPEPSALALCLVAGLGLIVRRRR